MNSEKVSIGLKLTLDNQKHIQEWKVMISPKLDAALEVKKLIFGKVPQQIEIDIGSDYSSKTSERYRCIPVIPKVMAQLWFLLDRYKDEIPVTIVQDRENQNFNQPYTYITRDYLYKLLEETESKVALGPKASGISPPVYLNEFWGDREYGRLDEVIGLFKDYDILPTDLLRKALSARARSKWAVLYSAKMPRKKEVLAAIRPLVDYRKGKLLEIADGYDFFTIDSFLRDLNRQPTKKRPYYIMVLGDFDVFHMEPMYLLQCFGGVGRLPFKNPKDFAKYAQKVIRSEKFKKSKKDPELFTIAADVDDINGENYLNLVKPLIESFHAGKNKGRVLAHGCASKSKCLEMIRTAPHRSILFVSAHGFEYTSNDSKSKDNLYRSQKNLQGSLVLDDFVEADVGSKNTGLLTGFDTKKGSFISGGIVILHSCYSGGTIRRDTMPEWIHLPMPPRIIPKAPFASYLCKSLLSNPDGPLAIYAHVNRSHQYDYYQPGGHEESFTYRQYHDLIQKLVDGMPIGFAREAARTMTINYMHQALITSHQIESIRTGRCTHGMQFLYSGRKPPEIYEKAFLQYSFATCNFRNYIILGDPMVTV